MACSRAPLHSRTARRSPVPSTGSAAPGSSTSRVPGSPSLSLTIYRSNSVHASLVCDLLAYLKQSDSPHYCIDRYGGYYITRLAANANPRVVAVHRQWRGRAIELEGKRRKEVAGRLQRDVLDVEVDVAFQRRVYAGIRRTIRRRVRLSSHGSRASARITSSLYVFGLSGLRAAGASRPARGDGFIREAFVVRAIVGTKRTTA